MCAQNLHQNRHHCNPNKTSVFGEKQVKLWMFRKIASLRDTCQVKGTNWNIDQFFFMRIAEGSSVEKQMAFENHDVVNDDRILWPW